MKAQTRIHTKSYYLSPIATCRAETDIEIPSRKANSLVDFRKLQGKRTPTATCC